MKVKVSNERRKLRMLKTKKSTEIAVAEEKK